MEWQKFMNTDLYNFRFTSFLISSFRMKKEENILTYTYSLDEYNKSHKLEFNLNDNVNSTQTLAFHNLLKLHNDAKVLKLLTYVLVPIFSILLLLFCLDIFVNNNNLFDFSTDTPLVITFTGCMGSYLILIIGVLMSKKFAEELVIYELTSKFNMYFKKNPNDEINMSKIRDLTILMIQDVREGKETIFEKQLADYLNSQQK